jgi:predicted nucleic acid-binding protein
MTPSTAQPAVVCDTDAASFIVKDDPIRGPRYLRRLQGRSVVLPFAALAELRLGAAVRSWGPIRRARMEQFIQGCTVHYPDDAMCTLWAALVATLRRAGQQIGPHDAWVAATALYLGVPLITHNAAHYRDVAGLQVVTESDRPAP